MKKLKALWCIIVSAIAILCCSFAFSACTGHTHSYTVTKVKPTCTENGYQLHECTCGVTYKDNTTLATGHDYTGDNVRCSNCGEVHPNMWTKGLNFKPVSDIAENIIGYKLSGIGSANACDIYIPAEYDGKPVTSIAYGAFNYCSNLTSIVIPSSVTSIENYALSSNSALSSITVAKGNKTYYSVDNCVIETDTKTLIFGCKNSVIPADGSVASIGDYAFYGNADLKDIVIPTSVTSIGKGAFKNCSLSSIVVPRSVSEIGENAFADCLTVYCEAQTKPSGWDDKWNGYIYDSYNRNCPVVWDCNNNDIADDGYAYTVIDGIIYGIKGNKVIVGRQSRYIQGELVIPSSVEYKGNQYNVKGIGESAFENCRNLISIVLPDTINEIGNFAFYNCDSLTIYCETWKEPDDWEYSWSSTCPVVWNCKNNDKDKDGYVYYVENGVRCRKKSNYSITVIKQPINLQGDLVIPYGVDDIGREAFRNCVGITSVEIPSTVKKIDSFAFCSCDSLTSIKFDGTMKKWDAISKGHCWNDGCPAETVVCSDGTITL